MSPVAVSLDPVLLDLLDALETRLGPVVRVVRTTTPPPGGSLADRVGHEDGLSMDITTKPKLPLPRLARVLETYPGVRVVADHPGWLHVQRID